MSRWGGPAMTMAVRAGGLTVAAPASLLNARLLIGALGATDYGILTAALSVTTFLPFLDLGAGASATTATARREHLTKTHYTDILAATFRALLLTGVAVACVALLLASGGAWASLVGFPEAPSLVLALPTVIFAGTAPLFIGNRVLVGADRAALVALQPPLLSLLILALNGLVIATGLSTDLVFAVPGAALVMTTALSTLLAARLVGVAPILVIRRAFGHGRRLPPVRGAAVPMAVTVFSITLLLESGRIVLSHAVGAAAVASYSLGAQLYTPMAAVASAAGQSLWPRFASLGPMPPDDRSKSVQARRSLTMRFGLVALPAAAGLLIAGPLVAGWVSQGRVAVDHGLFLAFAVLLLVVSSAQPAMLAFIGGGVRRAQAVMVAVLVVVGLSLSYALSTGLGAPGPPVAVGLTMIALVSVFRRADACPPRAAGQRRDVSTS